MKTLLVPSHGLDAITRDMLRRVSELPQGELRVITAGPGEETEAPEIRSKADFRAARAYRDIIRREGADLTFSPSTSGLATMLWATIGTGVRNIGYRGTQARVRRSDPTNWLALLNPRVAHIVCETADIREALSRKVPGRKLSVATKPFASEWVADAIARPLTAQGFSADGFELLYVGVSKGRPHKGLRTLLEALEILAHDQEGYHLTVVGDAEEADRDFARRLPADFIATTPDATRYMPPATLYILPSTRDASPRTLREAQACGVPCIVSDIPGARDLISPGETGLLVPPGSAGALAEAIRSLRAKPEVLEAMRGATKDFIVRAFDPEAYARQFLNLFKSL